MSMRDKIEHAIQNQPCTVKELKQKFGGERGADRKVMEALDELVREAVVCQRQGVFFTVRSGRADKALLCKVVKLGKNFAFVMLEDGTSDIFIPGRFTKGAMPGDDVLVEKFEHPRVEGSDEGAILAILTEKNDLVGTVRRVEGRLRFVPDDCPAITMPLARDCEGGAKDGDKVAVEILNRGNRQEDHRVGVAMRFGSSDEAKRCAKALLYAKDIRTRFPDKVRDEAKKFEGAEVSEKDCEGRMDLRALPIFTIDSAETKDIDDAISLTRTSDGGFELGVHIADVSNYVKPGTELDNEAFSRATSVYYADQVVPMLPKALSNGICSLNENELRLAFSCLMRLDKEGGLTDYRFVKSIIRSRVKGVYSEINALLAGTADAEIKAKYADVIDQLPAMKELYGHRARLRKERGCMDIESGEVKLILDENGRCIDVKKRTSGESESMIEEFMLLANQCAAHFARVKQIPFVYRVHEEPNGEKLERLQQVVRIQFLQLIAFDSDITAGKTGHFTGRHTCYHNIFHFNRHGCQFYHDICHISFTGNVDFFFLIPDKTNNQCCSATFHNFQVETAVHVGHSPHTSLFLQYNTGSKQRLACFGIFYHTADFSYVMGR